MGSPLINAAEKGDIEFVRKSYEDNIGDPRSYFLGHSNTCCRNLLHAAVQCGRYTFLFEALNMLSLHPKLVIDLICQKDSNEGNNPLHCAARQGNIFILKLLVNAYTKAVSAVGNNQEAQTPPWLAKNSNENTPLHYSLLDVVTCMEENTARYLISVDEHLLRTLGRLSTPMDQCSTLILNKVDESIVFIGMKKGLSLLVEQILISGLPYALNGQHGETPLHYASKCNEHKNPEKSEDEDTSVAKLFSIPEDRRLFPLLLSGLADSATEETMSSGSARPSASEILMRHARKRTADSSNSPASSRRRSSSRPAPEPIEVTPISRAPRSPVHLDELLLRLPIEFGDADRANYWPALERLLTPACSRAFDSTAPQEMTDLATEHCFLSLQSSLYLRKMLQRAKVECLASVGKNKELTATCARLREQLHAALKEKEAAKDQLARTQEANYVLTSGLTKAEARAEEMAELAKNVGAYTAFEGRIDCIRAYTEGRHTYWNLEEELAEFTRAFPNGMDLSALFPPEAEAANPDPEYTAMDISGAISGTVEEILAGETGDSATATPEAVQAPTTEKQVEHGEQSNGQDANVERIDLS